MLVLFMPVLCMLEGDRAAKREGAEKYSQLQQEFKELF